MSKPFASRHRCVGGHRTEIQAAAECFRGLGADVTVVETDLATTEGVDQLWAAAAGRSMHFSRTPDMAWRCVSRSGLTGPQLRPPLPARYDPSLT
jgi:hypothetical protein